MIAIMISLAFLFVVLQVFDVMLTNTILLNGGTERNPVVRWLMRRGVPLEVYKLILTAVTLEASAYVYSQSVRYGLCIISAACVVMLAIVITNFRQARKS